MSVNQAWVKRTDGALCPVRVKYHIPSVPEDHYPSFGKPSEPFALLDLSDSPLQCHHDLEIGVDPKILTEDLDEKKAIKEEVPPEEPAENEGRAIRLEVEANGEIYPEILLHKKARVPFGTITATPIKNSEEEDLTLELDLPGGHRYKIRMKGTHVRPFKPSAEVCAKMVDHAEKRLVECSKTLTEIMENDVMLTPEYLETVPDVGAPIPRSDHDPDYEYLWVACDRCSQWRRLPPNYQMDVLPQQWYCEMNPDQTASNCHVPQEHENRQIFNASDDFCAICLHTGSMGEFIGCRGPCLRAFHKKCAKLTPANEGDDWYCADCMNERHACFECGEVGKVGTDVFKCVDLCGKYYHPDCLQKHQEPVNTQQERQKLRSGSRDSRRSSYGSDKSSSRKQIKQNKKICPLHICSTCGQRGGKELLIKCVKCTTSYHFSRECRPPNLHLLSKRSFICPRHDQPPHPDTHSRTRRPKMHLTQLGAISPAQAATMVKNFAQQQAKPRRRKKQSSGSRSSSSSSSSSSRSSKANKSGLGGTLVQNPLDTGSYTTPLSTQPKPKKEKKAQELVVPLETVPRKLSPNLTLLSIGRAISDRSAYHNESHIFPVGFKTLRSAPSPNDPSKTSLYVSEIVQDGLMPKFVVTCMDYPDAPAVGRNPCAAWARMLRSPDDPPMVEPIVDGAALFGLSSLPVQRLIAQLPGANYCVNYLGVRAPEAPGSSYGARLSIQAQQEANALENLDIFETQATTPSTSTLSSSSTQVPKSPKSPKSTKRSRGGSGKKNSRRKESKDKEEEKLTPAQLAEREAVQRQERMARRKQRIAQLEEKVAQEAMQISKNTSSETKSSSVEPDVIQNDQKLKLEQDADAESKAKASKENGDADAMDVDQQDLTNLSSASTGIEADNKIEEGTTRSFRRSTRNNSDKIKVEQDTAAPKPPPKKKRRRRG